MTTTATQRHGWRRRTIGSSACGATGGELVVPLLLVMAVTCRC